MGLSRLLDRLQEFSDKFDHGPGHYDKGRVERRAAYHAFVRRTDFLSIDEFNSFHSDYAGTKLPSFFRYSSKASPDGYYKIGIMGKFRHPAAQRDEYLPTSAFFRYQLQRTKYFCLGALSGATGMDFSILGILLTVLFTILLFLLGLTLRLTWGIFLTLIQFIFVRTAARAG